MSIVLFTTLAGLAQGMAIVLAVATLSQSTPNGFSASIFLWAATGMLLAALTASFFHLGHPLRAWRAALMWRTSWMSREVIVLPAFILVIAVWATAVTIAPSYSSGIEVLAWATIMGALALWYCTAMIYACIRFIQEWAHPLTIINYVTLGLASGVVASGALAVLGGELEFSESLTPWAIALVGLSWATRVLSLVRNAGLKPRSSVQSATGINSARVVQKSMGMTGGSFNTREFFHGLTQRALTRLKIWFQALAFAVPLALLLLVIVLDWNAGWLIAFPIQFAGLVAERWFFFAQAQHPQNIYYQVIS
jgi:DMSO reductase anchor subunit